MSKTVIKQPAYQRKFDADYEQDLTDANIRNANANYIRSLSPFDSKFDRIISG